MNLVGPILTLFITSPYYHLWDCRNPRGPSLFSKTPSYNTRVVINSISYGRLISSSGLLNTLVEEYFVCQVCDKYCWSPFIHKDSGFLINYTQTLMATSLLNVYQLDWTYGTLSLHSLLRWGSLYRKVPAVTITRNPSFIHKNNALLCQIYSQVHFIFIT